MLPGHETLTILSFARLFRFSQRNWSFPATSTVNCPDYAATVTDFLSSYLNEIKRRGFFLQRLRSSSAGLTHLLECPASEPLRRTSFGTISIFDIWPGVVPRVELGEQSPPPHSSQRSFLYIA